MSSELTVACSLANPKIRQSIRTSCIEIKWRSEQASKIVEFFCDDGRSRGGVPHPAEMRSFLSNFCMEEEIDNILKKIYEFASVEANKVENILKDFQKFYETKMITTILEDEKGNASNIVARIKALEQIETSSIPLECLGEMDVDAIIAAELGSEGAIQSSFDFIRRSSPWGGYIRGQVVQFVAPPGVGKTLSLLNEAWSFMKNQNCQVHFLALGDMMRTDFITRFSSIATGVPFNEVAINPKKFYTEEVKTVLKNMMITVVPAGSFDALSLHDFIENQAQKVRSSDVIIVDYDANFATLNESMYKDQEIVYNTLSKLSRPENSPCRLVFVASQPKIQYWNEEELPMESAADSSRKQAIIDMMITFGRNPKIRDVRAGVGKVVKARRGKVNERSYYKITDCGRFEEVDSTQYTLLKTYDHRG